MKIAILTHPLGANYGGILQAYALSTYLRSQGHDVTILNRQVNLSFIKRIIKRVLIAFNHPRYCNQKYKHLYSFVKEFLIYTKSLSTDSQLTEFIKSNKIRAVIVGSDQVWRAGFAMRYGYNYFLDFVPNNVWRISYAASFGLSNWEYTNEQTIHIRNLLSVFKSLSVREDEGVTLCRNNLNIKVEHVLDPTLLLKAEDYDIVTSSRLVIENYIFVYWLGTNAEKQLAIRKANTKGKKIVDVSLRTGNTLIPVQDWLSYVKYADCVVTDSFHGCVFSILFQKQFTVCSNDTGGNGRLKSLFNMLGIVPSVSSVDYNVVSVRLDNLRRFSYDFLKKALQ